MKKFLSTLITLVIIGSSAQALPVSNPGEPGLLTDGILWEGLENSPCSPCASWCDSINIRTGFYGDYVLNRYLRTSGPKTVSIPTANTSNPAWKTKLTSSELSTQALYTGLNIWDRFEVFGTLGSTDAYVKGPSSAFNLMGVFGAAGNAQPNKLINNGTIEIYTKSIFSWSLGCKGVFYRCNNFYIGGEAQYAQATPELRDINVICNYAQFKINDPMGYLENTAFPLPTTSPTKIAKMNYSEWQFGVGCTYKVSFFAPYLAVKLSRANCKMDRLHIKQPTSNIPNPVTPANPGAAANTINSDLQSVSLRLNHLRSRKLCGLVVGTTFVDFDCISLNGEARLLDENAVYLNGIFRF